jgi:hypothetical protein
MPGRAATLTLRNAAQASLRQHVRRGAPGRAPATESATGTGAGETMDELTISPAYVRLLVLKARAVMAGEGRVTPDPGGNATDDPLPDTLQEEPGDLTREELVEELEGLDADHLDELVALMWLGRDDAGPGEWPALLALAAEREEVPDPAYLLDHPMVADHWAAGLEALGYGGLTD